jgi:hypothetical protein
LDTSLNFAELPEGPLELAGEAMLMAAEAGKRADLFADGSGHGQGSVNFRMRGRDVCGLFVDAGGAGCAFRRRRGPRDVGQAPANPNFPRSAFIEERCLWSYRLQKTPEPAPV